MTTRLGIFAKFWTPGRVKTRLAVSIGDDNAAALHRTFLETLLYRFASLADQRRLFCSPPESLDAFEKAIQGPLADAWPLAVQSGDDLGQRMHNFFERGFADGCERIVLIGSDSPDLPESMISTAFEQLRSVSVVLGPAEDGGYTLIGASGSPPPVFDNIAWGGADVLQSTLDRLRERNIEHFLLTRWADVDRIDDLRRLASSLADVEPKNEPLGRLRVIVEQVLKAAKE